MKKSMFRISKVFLILGLCWISVIGYSQDLKLNRKEKKEARKNERLKDYEALGALLESRKFVFATERVQGTTGAKIYNVIHVDGLRVFAALEDWQNTSGRYSGEADNTSPLIGPKGLFFEGDIGRCELSKDSKNLSYSIGFDVSLDRNAGIVYDITLNISANKSASVEITGQAGHIIYRNYLGYIRTD